MTESAPSSGLSERGARMTVTGRRTDMTPRVNRDRSSVLRASEFPEGDVAVRLDGGSR